jgi:uncharacterized membrane protein
MNSKAAITVNRPHDEVQRLWSSYPHRPQHADEATVVFKDAPGDRGTEIHVDLGNRTGLFRRPSLPKLKDELRHFKQYAETGEVPRSEGSPEGERFQRKFKQRPAQPLNESELERVNAR